jgi:predicted nucleotidyltransferase
MDKNLTGIIRDYKRSLENLGIKVERVILYGSRATGAGQEWSDIDIVVLSEDFAQMDIWERLVVLGKAGAGIRHPIEALGYTEKEYAAAGRGTFLGDEIKKKGVAVL